MMIFAKYAAAVVLSSLAIADAIKPHAGQSFLLKTADSETDVYNNLYITSLHTGAGTGDAVLTTKKEGGEYPAIQFYLNDTSVQWNPTGYPYKIYLTPASSVYADWQSVQINLNYQTNSFVFNKNGLVNPSEENWGHWLVCDWYHNNMLQLFYVVNYYKGKYPRGCAQVKLFPEYTSTVCPQRDDGPKT